MKWRGDPDLSTITEKEMFDVNIQHSSITDTFLLINSSFNIAHSFVHPFNLLKTITSDWVELQLMIKSLHEMSDCESPEVDIVILCPD